LFGVNELTYRCSSSLLTDLTRSVDEEIIGDIDGSLKRITFSVFRFGIV
jgi:hypothetical protein